MFRGVFRGLFREQLFVAASCVCGGAVVGCPFQGVH